MAGTHPALAAEEPCTRAAVRIEKEIGLPVGLLHAITLAETGKGGAPNANALRIEGRSFYPPSRKAAEGRLKGSDGTFPEEAYIGCMQLSMKTHARAFDRPESMLDPERNVRRAARLLQGYRRATGNWRDAIARFNGGGATQRVAYVCRIRAYLRALAPASATLVDGKDCPVIRPEITAANAAYAHAVRTGSAP